MDETSVPDPDRLLKAESLAQHWDCSRQFVYKLLSQGMPSVKIGRARRIRLSDAEAWLAAQQSKGGGAL